MKAFLIQLCLIGILCVSCTDFTPKPRGYMRIEPGTPHYEPLAVEEFPFTFSVSDLATVELPPEVATTPWMNIHYPSLRAKIYCSYLPITPDRLEEVEEETRQLILRQTKQVASIREQAYEDAGGRVYGQLFELDGESASPLQFAVTDRVRHFFRGALYFDDKPNVDSLAPAVHYLREDIVELIQSFRWKN